MACCEDVTTGMVDDLNELLPNARVVTISQIVQTQVTVNRLMKAISLIAMANDDLNHGRRNSIKPNLNADFRSLCSSQNAVTDNLFGDNITDQLKTIQEANKLGKRLSDEQSKSKYFNGNRKPFLGSRNFWTHGSRKRGGGKNGRGNFRPYRRNHSQDNRRQ